MVSVNYSSPHAQNTIVNIPDFFFELFSSEKIPCLFTFISLDVIIETAPRNIQRFTYKVNIIAFV